MVCELFLAFSAFMILLFILPPLGALVVLPEGQQRSGKQGGMVWSHNASGPYTRNRAIPVNPSTDLQVASRNAITSISLAWSTVLTQVQRDAWESYALNVSWTNRLGQTIHLSGISHFIRCNAPRVQNTIARIDAAPAYPDIGDPELELAATASEATQQLTVSGEAAAAWVGEADAWCFLYMGNPQSAARKFFGGPYKLLSAIPGAGPPPWPAILDTVWPFQEGQRIWLRCRIARGDGRLSEFAQTNFLAAA